MLIHLQGFPAHYSKAITSVAPDFGFRITNDYANADLRLIVDPLDFTCVDYKRDIAILAEPEVVRPDLYAPRNLSKYLGILPLGPYRAERLNLKYWIDWPVDLPDYPRQLKTNRKGVAIVNENKFSSSRRSMYGLRRQVIRYFEENFPGEFDLYGHSWNSSLRLEFRRRLYALRIGSSHGSPNLKEVFSHFGRRYKSCRGHMPSDCSLLQNHQLSICIENDLDYVSEKIWKSIYAGCPVHYVGPNLEYDPFLHGIVVPISANLDSIAENYKNRDVKDLQAKSSAGLDFLSSSNFKTYSAENRTMELFLCLKSMLKL